MSDGFNNPIVGGGGALVYPSIHSPNFVQSPLAGWAVNKDGSAFFGNLTLSGSFSGTNWVLNATGIFFYNGTPQAGNSPYFWAVASGVTTDPFGNHVQAAGGFGNPSGSHVEFEGGGNVNFNDAANNTRVHIEPGSDLIAIYPAGGASTHAPDITIADTAGTDAWAHSFPAGLNLAALPLTAGNTIINASGIFAYSALPPALGGLVASIAAVSGTDSAGNAYLAGESSYANLGGGFFQAITVSGGFVVITSAASAAGPWTVLGEIGAIRSDGDTHFAAVGGSHLVADTRLYALNPVTGSGRADWQDMRPLSNSWIGTIAGQYPPQYRLSADGFVDVAGYVQTPAANANYNSVTFATLPAAYRPAANAGHRWPVTMTTNVAPVGTPAVQIDTNGNLQCHNMPALMSSQVIGIYGRYPLNAPIAA